MLTGARISSLAERPAFCRAYWVTARPYLCFVSASVGLAGLASVPLSAPRLILAAAAFFLSYGFGQALTDISQTDTDAISSPYRPLVQGIISSRQVLVASLAGLVLCAAALAWLTVWNLIPAGLGVAGLTFYTPFKRRWWAGPAWNSAIVALLPLMGLLSGTGSPREAFSHPRLLPLLGTAFFSYATFVLLGYLKDVSADRATGYQTLPVRFGQRVTILVSAFCAVLAAAASAWLVGLAPSAPSPIAISLSISGLASLAIAHVRAIWVERDDEAHQAISWSARGIVLLHLGHAAVLRPSLLGAALLLAPLFELALARRPCRDQI